MENIYENLEVARRIKPLKTRNVKEEEEEEDRQGKREEKEEERRSVVRLVERMRGRVARCREVQVEVDRAVHCNELVAEDIAYQVFNTINILFDL